MLHHLCVKETYAISKPDQYYNQFEERVIDRDNVEYDFRLRLTPRSHRLIEYAPEFDDIIEEPKVVKEEPAKSQSNEKSTTARANGSRGRGSRTKVLKIATRPSPLRRKNEILF